VSYPDGPRDAEALAVDHAAGDLIVVTKRDHPARMYRVPLAARGRGDIATAEFVRELPLRTVTGFDISRDGLRLVALDYDALHVWRREPGETWDAALSRAPTTHPVAPLPKAEGVAFSADGTHVVVGSERLPGQLLTIRTE
jgi:hypothetical protein